MQELKEFKLGGRDCIAAPPPFTAEVCELIELLEESSRVARENDTRANSKAAPFSKNGRMLSLIRKVTVDCLVRGGHTPEDANEILSNITMSDDAVSGIPSLLSAIGLD